MVLAGDIGVGLSGVKWAVREAERLQKCAVYVSGNHEYYGERLNVLEKMRAMAQGSRVHVLDLDEVMLERVRFLGATLWARGDQGRTASRTEFAAFAIIATAFQTVHIAPNLVATVLYSCQALREGLHSLKIAGCKCDPKISLQHPGHGRSRSQVPPSSSSSALASFRSPVSNPSVNQL